MIFTKEMLEQAMLKWVQMGRSGDCKSWEETDQIPELDVAKESADLLWNLMGDNCRIAQMKDLT
jgi:hypothetical protein